MSSRNVYVTLTADTTRLVDALQRAAQATTRLRLTWTGPRTLTARRSRALWSHPSFSSTDPLPIDGHAYHRRRQDGDDRRKQGLLLYRRQPGLERDELRRGLHGTAAHARCAGGAAGGGNGRWNGSADW